MSGSDAFDLADAGDEIRRLKRERQQLQSDLSLCQQARQQLFEQRQQLHDELGRESQRCERAEGQVRRLQEALREIAAYFEQWDDTRQHPAYVIARAALAADPVD